MEAGKLRHRVTIQAPVITRDLTTGEMVHEGWSHVASVWAAVEPLSARDFIAAQAQQSEISGRIVIRYREGIDSTMRLVRGTTVYAIQGPPLPDKDSGREYLTILVSAGVTDGQ